MLSHKHLDHAGDVNVMIEAMCQGGWRPRGALCAPRDALDESMQPVVFPYARRFVPREWIVGADEAPFEVGSVTITASPRLRHPVETYGLHFRAGGATVSYIPVSYTHLDVYKRQASCCAATCSSASAPIARW